MCEQCVAAVDLWELFPGRETSDHNLSYDGWSLIRATQDGHLMRKGDWGLARVDDPEVIWSSPEPQEDPTFGFSDEQVNSLSAEETKALEVFGDALWDFRNALVMSPFEGHRLVEKAKQHGFDESKFNFDYWLFHSLGKLCKKEPDFKNE